MLAGWHAAAFDRSVPRMRGVGIATQNARVLQLLLSASLTLTVGCALWHRDDGSRALPQATFDAGQVAARDAGEARSSEPDATALGGDAGSDAGTLRATIVEPRGDVSIDAGGFVDFRGACGGPRPIVQEHWDVSGLKTSGGGPRLSHVRFADEGQYTVTLLCTDSAGARAMASLRVSAWRVPSVAFTAVAGPSTPKWRYAPSDDAYVASLEQLDHARQISPARSAPQDVLPRVGQPSYDADGQHVLAIAAYRSTYDEALLITPCRGAAGCDQSLGIQPLLHTPLEVRYAQWAPDFQSIAVAGEHDVYLVPVHAGVAGQEIHLSDAFADPAELDGQDVDKPHPALLFVGHGRGLAFRTRAKAQVLPIGLAIADVAASASVASGAAVTNQVALDLAPFGTDASSLGDLIVAPDGGNLAFTSVDRQWTGPVLQSAYALDIDAWLADPTTRPTQLPAGVSGHAINQLAVGHSRLWVYELADPTSTTSQAGTWLSYRWDGSDPIRVQERWPAFSWLQACGDYAVTGSTTMGAPLPVLQVTDTSTITSLTIDVGPHELSWTGFSRDCRYGLFYKEDGGLVVVDLVSQTVWFGPAFNIHVESVEFDVSGQYMVASDRFGPRHLLRVSGNQLVSVFDSQTRSTAAVLSHGAFYSLSSNANVFQPKPSTLLRIPLDGSDQVQSLGTFGFFADGLAAAPLGDEISLFAGGADGVSTNPGGLLQLSGGVSWQLLPLPAAPGGTVAGLTPLANRTLLMSGDFTQLDMIGLFSVQTDVGGATRRQTSEGFNVDQFFVAPHQHWFTAWQLTTGARNAVISAFGLDPSTDSRGARGSVTARFGDGQLIQDSFAPLQLVDQAVLFGSDGRVRMVSSEPASSMRAASPTHIAVSQGTSQAQQVVVIDVDDTRHTLVLPEFADSGTSVWFSPNDQWLLYAAGPDTNGIYHWRSADLSTGKITQVEALDGSALPTDLSDPKFTPDGQTAFILPPGMAVGGVWQCAGTLLLRQGASRVVAADTTTHPLDCAVFPAPDSSHFAYDSNGLYVAEVAHPEHVVRVGPAGVQNAYWSPDARYLVYFIGPYTAPSTAVIDLQHLESSPAALPHAVPYSLTFDRSGQRVLGAYLDGWDGGFAVWPMNAPSQVIRVGPAGWTVDSAVWVE